MEVFRLTRRKYSQVLSGKGAAIQGARWNSKGVEMIYTASSRALAMAEVSVYFTLATLPLDYLMLTIDVPDSIKIGTLDEDSLPEGWSQFPHPKSTKIIGDTFVNENRFCLLMVPSALVPGDNNYLINPKHSDFGKLRIVNTTPFPLNDRFFNK